MVIWYSCNIHPEYKVYAAELIFGNLLSSSNYNTKERIVGGKRTVLGAKLCAVFQRDSILKLLIL